MLDPSAFRWNGLFFKTTVKDYISGRGEGSWLTKEESSMYWRGNWLCWWKVKLRQTNVKVFLDWQEMIKLSHTFLTNCKIHPALCCLSTYGYSWMRTHSLIPNCCSTLLGFERYWRGWLSNSCIPGLQQCTKGLTLLQNFLWFKQQKAERKVMWSCSLPRPQCSVHYDY